MALTRNSMPPTPPSAEAARELLRKNAALTTRLAALGAQGAAAADALTKRGVPPSGELVQALGEAGREFAALRDEAVAAAGALGLAAAAWTALDSTRGLESLLGRLLEAIEKAEREAKAAAELTQTVAVLDRIAALTHREDAGFSALAACQSRAADVRAALASAGKPDPAAMAPFASLLQLMDGQQKLDDEHWSVLEDAVAGAFGRALAVAATRGKLVRGKR